MGYRETGRNRRARRGGGGESKQTTRGEERRFVQLLVCLALFLTVFVGKGVFPERLAQVEGQMMTLLLGDTDFRGAFRRLGSSLARQDNVLGQVGEFCVEVFGGGEKNEAVAVFLPQESQLEREQKFLNSRPDCAEFTAHLLGEEELPEEWFAAMETAYEGAAVPAVGTVLLKAEYHGPELPEGYTMDQISLGDLATVSPLTGKLWSPYGYRDHPIDGQQKFHNGVDLGADQGTDIGAFAAGTVEYIGESDVYGNYLQLDHGEGIKSFYAHCSRLCVGQGQQVALGEKVAEVGATGTATGPHLHFELKWEGNHIDPAYYITYTSPQ